jgi:hypothetical protein
MGANKTFQQKGDRGRLLDESDEFRKLRLNVALLPIALGKID